MKKQISELVVITIAIGSMVFCLFTLSYLPMFIFDLHSSLNGIPFNHSEMKVYNCDYIRNMDSIEVMEEYTIFKGTFGDRLVKNTEYYYDHCQQNSSAYYINYNSKVEYPTWCCFHGGN